MASALRFSATCISPRLFNYQPSSKLSLEGFDEIFAKKRFGASMAKVSVTTRVVLVVAAIAARDSRKKLICKLIARL